MTSSNYQDIGSAQAGAANAKLTSLYGASSYRFPGLREVEVGVTQAQVRGLSSSAIGLVPAPGAGFALVPHFLTTIKGPGAAGAATSALIRVRYGTTTALIPLVDTVANVLPLVAAASVRVRHIVREDQATVPENEALELSASAAITLVIGGLVVKLVYEIIDV